MRQTNIFVTLGGVKVAESPYNGQSVSFDFYVRTELHGELTLFVSAQDASGGAFQSEKFTNYFPSQLSARLLTPTTTNVTVRLGEGIPISADAHVDFGRINGLYLSMDTGGDYPETYVTPSPTQFTWYPRKVATYQVLVSPFIDTSSLAQNGFFTATVKPWRLPWITRQAFYFATNNGGKIMVINSFSAAPQSIQWLHNGRPIPGATNSNLTIDPPQPSDDGYYLAQIDNFAGRVVSDMADHQIDGNGGGLVLFSNHTDGIDAPIYSPGQTPLAPPFIRVQLLAGATINRMHAVTPEIVATNGYFDAGAITLPNIAPGQKAYVQVIAKDEIPLLLETGLFGRSPIMEITAGASTPTPLPGQIPLILVKYGHYIWPQFTPDTPPSVRQGASTELKISFLDTSGLPVIYFWSKNGVPIPGATNATLRINNAQTLRRRILHNLHD